MDYNFKTTFWSDFTIADKFGESAIQETFNRTFKEWKNNYIYLTELVLVLNWKSWNFYQKRNESISNLYCKLYNQANDYAFDNLKDNELDYFIETTD